MTRGAIASLSVAVAVLAGIGTSLWVNSPGRSDAEPVAYDVSTDDQKLFVTVGVGRLDSIGIAATDEDASTVRVQILLIHNHGSVPSDLRYVDVQMRLNAPLAERAVVDARGQAIPHRKR